MAGNQMTSFIIISSLLLHTQSANVQYSAVMPHTVTALTGSCVQIPCTFNISNFKDKFKKTFYGIWLKKIPQYGNTDSFIAFNSSENIIKGFSDIQMTGDLSERNCTTVFYNIMMNHSDIFYFRLETELDEFKATFTNQPVRISVTDSPQQIELKPKKPIVMEESTVNLSCSAEAPCPKQPPTISWSNIPESASITTNLLEKPDKTQSVLSNIIFKASYRDHKRNISCIVMYPRETSNDFTVKTNVTLIVYFPPKETRIIISPSASVSAGTNVTLTCKTRGSPSNNMTYTWYKRGKDMAAQKNKITFTVSQNNTGFYFCNAQNKHGNQSSRPENIQLTSEGSSHPVIYGCTGGLLALILLSAVCFYYLRIKTSGPAHDTGSNQATDKNSVAMAIYANNAFMISKKNEEKETADLHYGEIDFSKLQTGHTTREFSNNDPQTEYAELQVTEKKTKINN